jgi:hypothetical protein
MTTTKTLLSLLLLGIFSSAFGKDDFDYSKAWKEVTSLEDVGKLQDASTQVEKILVVAQKADNLEQSYKATVYRFKYQSILEEDSERKIVAALKKLIQESTSDAATALYEKLLAEVYYNYFSDHTYELMDRTTSEASSDDFMYWDARMFVSETRQLYLSALQKSEVLKAIPLGKVPEWVVGSPQSKLVFPSMYDLLAWEAFNFFSENTPRITQVREPFAIDNPLLFGSAADFAEIDLSSPDSLSFNLLALSTLQQWTRERSTHQDEKLRALIDMKRFTFVHTHFSGEDKDEWLEKALTREIAQTSNKDNKAAWQYQLASLWHQQALNKEEGHKTLVEIRKYCQNVARDFPGTDGAFNCAELIKQIEMRSLSFVLEEAVVPTQAFKAFVSYKNLSQLQYRILELKADQKFTYYQQINEVWAQISKSKLIKTGSFKLPGSDDHQDHSIELPFDQLKEGRYAMVIYNGDLDKNPEQATMHLAVFWVTNLSITSVVDDNGNYDLLVRDRLTGLPIAGVAVTAMTTEYNYSIRSTETKKLSALVTDEKGTAKFKLRAGEGQRVVFDIKKGADSYSTSDAYLYKNQLYREQEGWNTTLHLFTDGALYRPGQTVYFKGIVTERKEEQYRAGVDKKVSVTLRDANYQTAGTLEYTTNEFGSFSGFFELPIGSLPGVFQIQSEMGSASFRVEEYKRPNFEVKTNPIEGTFKLEDTVQVTGKATAYSGASIANATVKYSVKRVAWYPWWWGWFRRPTPSAEEQVITHGTALTDASGAFDFQFIAAAPKSKRAVAPFYNYEVQVEVTDVNGETQSAKSTVRIGQISIDPNVVLPEVWQQGQAPEARLSARNLQDQALSADFKLSILPLIGPSKPLKDRYWGEPDQFFLSQQQHEARFPFDIYKDEANVRSWEQGKPVWERQIRVDGDSMLSNQPNNLTPGIYLFKTEVKADNGDTVSLSQTFEVRAAKGISPIPAFIKMTSNKTSLQPGDTLELIFQSAMPSLQLFVSVYHKGITLLEGAYELKSGSARIQLPIKKEMLGGIQLMYHTVVQNRVIQGSTFFEVPFEPLERLSYEWKTIRNKVEPGAEERWELHIKGKNGEAVAAEVLATLYDASLDAFAPHRLLFNLSMPIYRSQKSFMSFGSFRTSSGFNWRGKQFNAFASFRTQELPYLNNFGFEFGSYSYLTVADYARPNAAPRAIGMMRKESRSANDVGDVLMEASIAVDSDADGIPEAIDVETTDSEATPPISFRKNFNETAFFFPQIKTDTAGNVIMAFTMPEALTRWKLLGLAHDRSLQYTHFQEEIITSKDLMITPNKMRFFRMGDELVMQARISNLTELPMSGTARLNFRDAATNQLIDSLMLLSVSEVAFEANAGESGSVQWAFKVPFDLQGVIYEVSATSGKFTDAETGVIPVLENRMLLTEAMPIFVNRKGKYNFSLDKFKTSGSGSIQTQSLTFEYTSHPVWQALMALPYLAEQKDESSTQTFSRFYANSMAAYILKQVPQSKALLQAWQAEGSLKSALEKHPELKMVVLEATPWLRDAQSETEQMQQLIRLFEEAENQKLQEQLLQQLKKLQTSNGGLTWFPGMPDDRYLTQYFAGGFGHLKQLGALDMNAMPGLEEMIKKMVAYLDMRSKEDFEEIKRRDSNYLSNDHLGWMPTQYLYVRSFFPEWKIQSADKAAFDYFMKQAEQYAIKREIYSKGMLSLALHRHGNSKVVEMLISSLRQTAITSTREGMYWKSVVYGGYWYEAPIETQALMVEVFSEITGDKNTVDALKTRLLRQKQTSRWKSPRATADACYALLLSGGSWTSETRNDQVQVGRISLADMEAAPGTGYIKKTWDAKDVSIDMATVQITKKGNNPSWGALYWQYWEDMDKVTSASNDLILRRTVYKVVFTDAGEVLMPIDSEQELHVGDKIRVRLEIQADRDLEFVHISDSRGSGMEPLDVLSGYQYKSGLWAYMVTGDAATHWYIDRLRKGSYTMEYTVFAAAAGHYISGVAQGECLYAPEFRAHTNGVKVMVKP